MKCEKCGREISVNDKFCPECGKRLGGKGGGKKTAAVIAVIALGSAAAVGGAMYYQTQNGYKNITAAEKALSADDPDKAAEYLEAVSPKSKYYTQAQSLLNDINTAKKYCEEAERSLAEPSYVSAMNACDEARKYNTNMPRIDEIYSQAQDGLAKYLNKQIDMENYSAALQIISKLDPELKNSEIDDIEKSILAMRDDFYEQGNKHLSDGDVRAAYESLKTAEAIDPNYTDETGLRDNITKTVTDKISSESAAGNLDTALEYINIADEIGGIINADAEKSGIAKLYAEQGSKKFYAYDITGAGEYAQKALEIDPNCAEAKTLQGSIKNYNAYVQSLNQAKAKYRSYLVGNDGADILAAQKLMYSVFVPNLDGDSIAKMVWNQYESDYEFNEIFVIYGNLYGSA